MEFRLEGRFKLADPKTPDSKGIHEEGWIGLECRDRADREGVGGVLVWLKQEPPPPSLRWAGGGGGGEEEGGGRGGGFFFGPEQEPPPPSCLGPNKKPPPLLLWGQTRTPPPPSCLAPNKNPPPLPPFFFSPSHFFPLLPVMVKKGGGKEEG